MLTMQRFFSGLGFNTSYLANLECYPILLRSAAYAVTNVSCRGVSCLAPLMADELSNPMIWTAIMSIMAIWASFNAKPLKEKTE